MLPLPLFDRFQDIAVARGLARQASVLSGYVKDALLLDVTYRAIYLAVEEWSLAEADGGDPDDGAIRDAAGTRLVCLVDKHRTIPTDASLILERPGLASTAIVEIREPPDTPGSPYELVARFAVELGEPVAWMGVRLDVDTDRTLRLELRIAPCGPQWPTDRVFGPLLPGQRGVWVQLNNLHLDLPPVGYFGIVQTKVTTATIRLEPPR
jgi:hypothetical protein